jgi:AcrR family transcriptional regulator
MASPDSTAPNRVGRPPKVDRHGTPTRKQLLNAAADTCVEFGYEGATPADFARRANVSTPAVYSHFSGKADLLVETCQREL